MNSDLFLIIVLTVVSCASPLLTALQAQVNLAGHEGIPTAPANPRQDVTAAAGEIPVEGYRLAWADEFDGARIDSAKWGPYGEGGRGGGAALKGAATVGDGLLMITTCTEKGKRVGGMLSTLGRLERSAGYFEARIKFEGAPGTLSVFRIESQRKGIRASGLVGPGMGVVCRAQPGPGAGGASPGYGPKHLLVWGGASEVRSSGVTSAEDVRLADGFHVYGFEVDKNGRRFFVDGKQKWSVDEPVPTLDEFVVLGLEVEERASPGLNPGSGSAGGDGQREPRMVVDYVRFFEPSVLSFGDYAYATNAAGEATIIGFSGSHAGKLSITNVLGGCPVTRIKERAFAECGGLASVTIPGGITRIPVRAFFNCQGFKEVTIPDSVTSIDHEAFSGCGSLTGLTIPRGVTSIANTVFDGCASLSAITVDPANPSYSSADGALLDKGQTTLIRCPPGRAGSYAIPDGVTRIERKAFYGCGNLTSVTIPAGITGIGPWAFGYCKSLADVAIPDSVASIGSSAFYGCSNLVGVTIQGSAANIAKDAFAGCARLTNGSLRAYGEDNSRARRSRAMPARTADTIEWDSAKASITPQGSLTVEVTVKVALENSPGKVSLFLQKKEKIQDESVVRTPHSSRFQAARFKVTPLGDPNEADVTVEKGKKTLTLKRTIVVPKDLAEVDVWTPLYVGSGSRTSIAKKGQVTIAWPDNGSPSANVIMPE